jgi:hypothetical protein
VQCLVGLAAEFLPDRISVGRWTLPVNRIGEVLTTVWENEDLIRAYWAQAGDRDGGYLRLRQM